MEHGRDELLGSLYIYSVRTFYFGRRVCRLSSVYPASDLENQEAQLLLGCPTVLPQS